MKTSNNVCEENTFARLYGDLGAAIRNFIYFKCGDSARAEDLTHEAFIKLWQNCAKVPQEKAKSFLYTVSNNMFLNEVAHRKVVLQHAKLQPQKVNAQSPEYLLEEKQYHKRLQQAISNLTEAQRTAFLLNRIEGKKYAEIAEILSISVKAVEKRMSQALASLRKEIEEL
jgi:RNA polymerase sigma-70 factor (ECF subfamily)